MSKKNKNIVIIVLASLVGIVALYFLYKKITSKTTNTKGVKVFDKVDDTLTTNIFTQDLQRLMIELHAELNTWHVNGYQQQRVKLLNQLYSLSENRFEELNWQYGLKYSTTLRQDVAALYWDAELRDKIIEKMDNYGIV